MPSVTDKVLLNISTSDTQISMHTFRVRYVHCASHCEYRCNYKGCSSSLRQSFMPFWEKMELLFGHSFEFHLLLWLACDVTEWWLPQCPPLAWSKWHFACEVPCAVLSLLLILCGRAAVKLMHKMMSLQDSLM